MARKRDIRPEFFTDEKLSEIAFGARILFAGLWCHADLRGVFEHNPRILKGLIFPLDEGVSSEKISSWLLLLADRGLVLRFESQGKVWGWIRSWNRHQKPCHREIEIGSLRPQPPGWQDPPEWSLIVENGIKKGRARGKIYSEQF